MVRLAALFGRSRVPSMAPTEAIGALGGRVMEQPDERLTRLEPGTRFAGYRIEGMLERGGMGVVYRATDEELNRTVALKIIAPEHTQNADAVRRFKAEARLAASLEHPNIVPIHQAGQYRGVLYLAMRFVPGTNLRQLIDRGRLDLDHVQRIITAVASALDAAHAGGLVHRDVKPANILISGEGDHEQVYLADFGLTKRLGSVGSLTRTGAWVGTPDYVAPEQIKAAPVDGRADVYSLGCVLYEMLVGEVAYPKDNDMAKLWAHVQDPCPAPSEKRPELVKAFDDVVACATAKEPDDRYGRASDLAAAVAAALGEQRAPEIDRAAVTVVRLLRGRARDDVVEGLDELRALLARRRARVLDVRPELRHVVVLGVRDLANEHLVQHAAQGVDVGAAVDRRGLDLLGGDVIRRAHPCAGARQAADRPEPLGAGRGDLLVVGLAADQDVRRLDVAVHQATRVGGVERRGHRRDDALHVVEVQSAPVVGWRS